MGIIQDMPNEILFKILSLLSHQDLLATSLVSHIFYTITQSPLYEKPCLYINGGNRFYHTGLAVDNSDQSYVPGSVITFLRTLLLAPGRETLAHYVRALTIDLDVNPETTIPRPDIDMLTVAASNLGFDGLALTEQGAQIILILRLLPRLTSLRLRDAVHEGTFGYTILEDALKFSDTIPLGLRNIHQFRCSGIWKFTGITPEMIVRLLGLPSIRKITVSTTEDNYENEAFMTAAATAAGTSPVTELSLNSSDISIKSLELVLKIPKALTNFYYDSERPIWGINIADFGQALLPLQSSLQRLSIFFSEMGHIDDYPYANGDNIIGTLRGWKALRSLSVQLIVLLGDPDRASPTASLPDLLPLGLSSLLVEDDRFWSGRVMVDQLIKVLERGEMVVLRKLTLMLGYEGLTTDTEERLTRACRVVDVELDINKDGLDGLDSYWLSEVDVMENVGGAAAPDGPFEQN